MSALVANELPWVSCRECGNFTPDTIGDGMGNGRCKVFDDYVAKGASQKNIDSAVMRLGNQYGYTFFWPGPPGAKNRQCERFIDA